MNSIVQSPSSYEIDDNPELALLCVLEFALRIASNTLGSEHPAVGRIAECYDGRLPPRQILLAQLIADRCTELSDLIGWYRRSCPHVFTNRPDADDAESLPF